MNLIKKERGVVLLLSFFIMSLALSVVLGISTILLGGIKVMRELGNSVVSFYTADTGIEEILYFDNQEVPEGGARGFCNICNVRVANDCSGTTCTISGIHCELDNCTDCEISYCTVVGDKTYDIDASIDPLEGVSFKSFGIYKKTTRAIELNMGI